MSDLFRKQTRTTTTLYVLTRPGELWRDSSWWCSFVFQYWQCLDLRSSTRSSQQNGGQSPTTGATQWDTSYKWCPSWRRRARTPSLPTSWWVTGSSATWWRTWWWWRATSTSSTQSQCPVWRGQAAGSWADRRQQDTHHHHSHHHHSQQSPML